MAELFTTKAVARGLSHAPRKVGLVASLVRGRTVADALVILEHTPKRTAKPIAKLINSAKANATTNHGIDGSDLMIESIEVSAGPRLKRFRPAAHGRALPYQKKSSHITVVVSGIKKPAKTASKPKETKKETK